jgi:hypothetical protein
MTTPAASLSMFLDGLVDYAGLFPPANLDMEPMVQEFSRGIESEHNWMLGRVIVPLSRLDEFEIAARPFLPSGPGNDPWVLSVLMSTSGDDSFEQQIGAIGRFNDKHGSSEDGGAIIDVVEFRGSSASSIESALDLLPDDLFPFVELAADQDIRGLLAVLVGSDAGAKIRTGGITPELYPTTAQLANFIAQCASADVPFKATAGLHHPLRNHNEDVPAMQFGFLNVFAAAILARVAGASADELAPFLTLDSLDGIDFGPDSIRLGDEVFTLEDIEETRIAFALSFGSCSFDDPVHGLQSLGLLPS